MVSSHISDQIKDSPDKNRLNNDAEEKDKDDKDFPNEKEEQLSKITDQKISSNDQKNTSMDHKSTVWDEYDNMYDNSYEESDPGSDPGSYDCTEMIVVASSEFTVTRSNSGVERMSSFSSPSPPKEETNILDMELSSRSPDLESSSRSPDKESSSRSIDASSESSS